MATRALQADETDVFRSLRLAALSTDPDAFSSDAARESAFAADRWARPLAHYGDRRGAVIVDFVDGEPVGMTGVGEHGDEAVLWGMWVVPAARGRGVGDRLLDAAASWARAVGSRKLGLWVMRSNAPAIALYRRARFEPIEDGAPPPPSGCTDELFMRRSL